MADFFGVVVLVSSSEIGMEILGVPREALWDGLEQETSSLAEAVLNQLRAQAAVLIGVSIDDIDKLEFVTRFKRYEVRRDLSRYLAQGNPGRPSSGRGVFLPCRHHACHHARERSLDRPAGRGVRY